MWHKSKIFLRIILERIRVKAETEIADELAGFWQGRGQETKSWISECWCRRYASTSNHSTCALWTAFDSISHDKLWVTMMDMGYPLHFIHLLAKLYRKQLAKVKVAGTLSEWFHVKKGVWQACVFSLYMFNILAEMVMRDSLGGFHSGLQIGGRIVTNLCYADDIILLATS